jgi:hypothetical protein
MKIQEWMHKHKRRLSLSMGGALILIALGMLFWDNTGTPVVSEEEVYAQKVEAMEARMSGGAVTPPQESPIMKAYKEKQAKHLRYMLIVVVLTGIGFLVHGLMTKKREE